VKRSGTRIFTTTIRSTVNYHDSAALIIGDIADDAVRNVRKRLSEAGIQVPFVDPTHPSTYTLSIDESAGALLEVDGAAVRLSPETRVWQRRANRPNPGSFRHQNPEIAPFSAAVLAALWGAFYALPAVWMNRHLHADGLQSDKIHQARLAHRAGLATIPTLFTSSPSQFRRFVENVADVAIKSPVPWRAEIAGSDDWYGTYTRRVSRQEALEYSDRLGGGVIVQPYVDKAYELRITVVDSRIFACRIDSQASDLTRVDWRHYDLDNVAHSAIGLYPTLERRIHRLMRHADLRFACMDFIVEPNGTHRFVELNPSGQFGWVEGLTGLAITDAIVDWLTPRKR